uniref:Hepatocyte growth factor-regulated tyrosine kinase substrate n=1 Tax=Steinernema glaseri TaxID=37863 RepID=A0A1I7YAF0_9BILA
MSKRFEKTLDLATDNTLIEPNWDGILSCVDAIRGGEVTSKVALVAIQKRIHSDNPHTGHHALLTLEACVKNCGAPFHKEVATKAFMEDMRNLASEGTSSKIRDKVLELIQCWASAFKSKSEYKIVVDTHNLMKLSGVNFPAMKEADAMFLSESAPEWADGDVCFRCRAQFGILTRKHHCRACGQVFCDRCSGKQMILPNFGIEKMVRVCDTCYNKRTSPNTQRKNDGAQNKVIEKVAERQGL